MRAPTSIASRDLDEAREIGGSAYFPHSLICHGDPSAFAMRLRSVTVGPLLVGVLGYDVEVHIETTRELDTAYEINVPLAGEMDCWVGGRYTVGSPSRAVVNGPSCTSTLHGFGPGRPLFGLKVGRDALEAQYHVLHGHPTSRPLELRPCVELDSTSGRQWWALARMLLDGLLDRTEGTEGTAGAAASDRTEGSAGAADSDGAERAADSDGLLSNPMVARPLVDAILRGLLVVAAEPVYGVPGGRVAGGRVAGAAGLRAAIEYLREHASEPLTVADIAAAGGCSVRALQEAFRGELATTPMAYLQRVRLARAHADLLAGDPAHETVNDVSWRWGFTHAGRFAAAYRQAYGIRPSKTLHA